MIGCGIITIIEFKNNTPEDNKLSSGYSVLRSSMEKIDNYKNVINYQYESISNLQFGQTTFHLKDIAFSFFEEIDVAGMPDTQSIILEENLDDEQYPQGICMTEEFVFVTSYSDNKDVLGECMVFDRMTGELLVTLGMDKNSHLGGIAFDGKNIWVCNSSKMAIERLSYSFIRHAVSNNKGSFVNVTNMVEIYTVSNIPSSIAFYNGSLYVATHTKWSNSKMISYVYDEFRNVLGKEFVYKIPSKVQGIAFDEYGGIFLSTSYGRKNSSYIKKYASIYVMTRDVEDYLFTIEMPPCSEGIALFETKLYILFESAGKKYLEGTDGNGKSTAPLDKILIIDLT